MKEEEEREMTIHESLASVMANIGGIEKTGNNTGLGYTYATEADLLNAIQPELANHGVMLRKSASEVLINDFDERGRHRFLIRVEWAFESSHPRGVFKTESFGYAECRQGFGPAKAQTQSLKYVMRQTFCIPTGDDPDETALMEENEEPEQARLILETGFNDTAKIKELGGARSEWDRSGPGKDQFLHWWVEDTPENRERFEAYIPKEIDMLKKMKIWADKHYHGFEIMEAFCLSNSSSKTPPKAWTSEVIADFMTQMDSGNGVRAIYDLWNKGRNNNNAGGKAEEYALEAFAADMSHPVDYSDDMPPF